MKTYRFGIRSKIVFSVFLGTLMFGALIVFVVFYYLNQTLTRSLVEQGYLLGSNVSEFAAEKLIEDDILVLRKIIEKYRLYPNIEYILIEDFNREIKTDTYNGNVPPELIGKNHYDPTEGKAFGLELLQLSPSVEQVRIYDVLVPIREGLLGFVRVGMRKSYIDQQIKRTILTIGGVILGGMLLAILMALIIITVQITRPIIHLMQAAEKISLGDFNIPIEVRVKNELHDLSVAIDRMRESLRTCIERLKQRSGKQ